MNEQSKITEQSKINEADFTAMNEFLDRLYPLARHWYKRERDSSPMGEDAFKDEKSFHRVAVLLLSLQDNGTGEKNAWFNKRFRRYNKTRHRRAVRNMKRKGL